MVAKIRLLTLFTVSLVASQVAIADIEFICPCVYQSGDPTSSILQAGVRNLGAETTGDIRIVPYAQNAIGQEERLSRVFLAPLGTGAIYPNTSSFKSPFASQIAGDYEIYASLWERVGDEWDLQDKVRFEPNIYLEETGGESTFPHWLYFDGAATVSFSDEMDEVTISLPPIKNGSYSEITDSLTVRLGQFSTPAFWRSEYITVEDYALEYTLGPSEESTAVSITMPFTPRSDREYLHLWVWSSEDNQVYLWQNVSSPTGFQYRDFLINSIDMLEDSDGDGVSDVNESLMQTNPQNASSKPGASVLDVMVLYTPGVTALYKGDHLTRIMHVLEYGNESFQNAGIEASLRLVHLEEIQFSESVQDSVVLAAMKNRDGVFSDLQEKRIAAGADLVILYRPDFEGADSGGRGTLPGLGFDGDFKSKDGSDVFATAYISEWDHLTIHEFGHNMGLGHDRREESNRGTFLWSRGHGVDAEYATVMTYGDGFSTRNYLRRFSSPKYNCRGESGLLYPCGVDKSDTEQGADAALSIDTVRFQVAQWAPDPPDTDGDGLINFEDAFPLDATEQADTDGDGIGNNADTDGDNDGLSDALEISLGLNPLDADTDHDGLPDGWENANGLDPVVADYMVSAGYHFACALDDTGVVCWGRNVYGQTTVPSLANPTQVSAGDYHACALDDTGVVCWGDNYYGQATVPSLTNPTRVSAGWHHTCALDDTGVVCWGRNEYDQTTVPSLDNPTQVSAGSHHTCSLDDTGVVCWGDNDDGESTVPSLDNPTQVSAGYRFTCALDDTGVVCWGSNSSGRTTVPSLANPSQVSAGDYHACALDDTGVVCWGSNSSGQTTVPSLANPAQADAGWNHTCALDDMGVVCWGDNYSGQATVPDLLIDPDGDGYSTQGEADAFPLDASEWLDTDSDGIGNNADTDDDNDGYSDALEISLGLDPLDANDVTGSPREIFWRNAENGQNVLWSMETQHLVARNVVNIVHDLSWKVIGLADFTGDGQDEVLFRHANGDNRVWTMVNGQRVSSDTITGAHSDWSVAALGDFDADGDADLFWRNQETGAIRYWEMDGLIRLSSLAVRSVPLDWKVAGSGDFDGDGRNDLFWRHSTGANVIWLMESEEIATRSQIRDVDPVWEVSGIGDFDGDGMDDIFWQDPSTGNNSIWLLNGAELKSRHSLPKTSVGWRAFGVLDMNGDSFADILLRHNVYGSNRLWLMNGATRTHSLGVAAVPDLNWEPVAVGNTP
jgi:hypothetical protein